MVIKLESIHPHSLQDDHVVRKPLLNQDWLIFHFSEEHKIAGVAESFIRAMIGDFVHPKA